MASVWVVWSFTTWKRYWTPVYSDFDPSFTAIWMWHIECYLQKHYRGWPSHYEHDKLSHLLFSVHAIDNKLLEHLEDANVQSSKLKGKFPLSAIPAKLQSGCMHLVQHLQRDNNHQDLINSTPHPIQLHHKAASSPWVQVQVLEHALHWCVCVQSSFVID